MHAATLRRRARLASGFAPQTAATVANFSALDIVEIRHFPLREPVSGNRYSLLRVKTRLGLTGWGECAASSADDVKALEAAWVGKPASTYAAITPQTPCGGALDMAFLDIVGKACNAPVYRVRRSHTQQGTRLRITARLRLSHFGDFRSGSRIEKSGQSVSKSNSCAGGGGTGSV